MNKREITALRILHDHRWLIGVREGDQTCSCGGWDWRNDGHPVSHDGHLAAILADVLAPENSRPVELCACGWSEEEHDPREHRPTLRDPISTPFSTEFKATLIGNSSKTLRHAAQLLREWWPSGCECHEMERELAGWLELVAHQIDEASGEFSLTQYPVGHDRRAMRIALAILAAEEADN